jgi:tRNA A-37 threonylcarbamoyl transferase component Bud32
MFTHVPIPSSFTLIKKGKTFLLIKQEYKNLLFQQGIEDFEIFLEKSRQSSNYLKGRTLHPSIPVRNGERVVLRQYVHGGLFRNFTRSLYLFGSRSFRELALTSEIQSCGIPTIQPVAAIHRFILSRLYQAYLLSLEIPHSKDLIEYFQAIGPRPSRESIFLKRRTIRSVGLLLQRFHQSGFYHGDLQLKNILVAGDQILLIDFDRSYRKRALSLRERMKNLLRLDRSVEKWRLLGLPITRTDRWRFLLAYAGEDVAIRKAMEKVIRTYSIRHFLYRFGWAFENIVGSSEFGVRSLDKIS